MGLGVEQVKQDEGWDGSRWSRVGLQCITVQCPQLMKLRLRQVGQTEVGK